MKYSADFVMNNCFYLVAPILYHTSVNGNSSYYCSLFIEFVDTYVFLILVIFFIFAILLFQNLVSKVFTFKNVSEFRALAISKKVNLPTKSTVFNVLKSSYTSTLKLIKFFKK